MTLNRTVGSKSVTPFSANPASFPMLPLLVRSNAIVYFVFEALEGRESAELPAEPGRFNYKFPLFIALCRRVERDMPGPQINQREDQSASSV